jgi:hypothetical protein
MTWALSIQPAGHTGFQKGDKNMKKATTVSDEIAQCVLCGVLLNPRFGNNPYPLAEHGDCCATCNEKKVIPARMKALIDGAANGAA